MPGDKQVACSIQGKAISIISSCASYAICPYVVPIRTIILCEKNVREAKCCDVLRRAGRIEINCTCVIAGDVNIGSVGNDGISVVGPGIAQSLCPLVYSG